MGRVAYTMKGDLKMLLFLMIAAIIFGLIMFAVFIAGTFGAAFTIIFSDVIVCIGIFALIFWLIKNRKNKSR